MNIFTTFTIFFFLSTFLLTSCKKATPSQTPLDITSDTPLYLTADKGTLWDTIESTSRISTFFTQAEIETTFITLDDVLHAYATWTDDDAPYSSAFTKYSYTNYILDLEFKWGIKKFNPRLTKPRDAGIIFHVYGDTNMPWPSGLEYQLKEPNESGGFVSVRTRALVKELNRKYDPSAPSVLVGKPNGKGTEHISPATTIPPNSGWNTVRMEVSGDSATYYLNSEKVMEFTNAEYYEHSTSTWLPLTHGRIILQAEGAEIEYRNIILSPLNP